MRIRRAAVSGLLPSLLVAMAGATALAGCATVPPGSAPVSLDPSWTLTGFADPESVLRAVDAGVLYVSNVSGEGDARDGDGFVSKVSVDGKMLVRQWAVGLDAPKGLARIGGTLFVADIDDLVEIDLASGRVTARHPVPEAKFLNDVAVAPDGTVLVSDSGTGRIHGWRDGTMSVWLADPLLAAINGLLPEGDHVLVTTMQGRLLSVDLATRAITVVAEDLGNADGVGRLPDGSLLVSEWPGRLFHLRTDGTRATLLDTREAETYLNDLLLSGDELLMPNMKPGQVSAYRVIR